MNLYIFLYSKISGPIFAKWDGIDNLRDQTLS